MKLPKIGNFSLDKLKKFGGDLTEKAKNSETLSQVKNKLDDVSEAIKPDNTASLDTLSHEDILESIEALIATHQDQIKALKVIKSQLKNNQPKY